MLLLASAAAAGASPMALELWINGVSTHRTLLVEAEGGAFVVARSDLREQGVLVDGGGAKVALDGKSEVRAMLDEGGQRLLVTAPPARLAPQVFDLHPPLHVAPDRMASGVILDYDVSAEAADVAHLGASGSLATADALSLFTPYGVLRGNGFARLLDGHSQGARLDTSLLLDDPAEVQRWVVGDAVSGSLSWSRAVRFAGFQLASDYTLRPDLVTIPLPQFFGEAAVPSSVDVFVGATKVFETDVDPGPFELRNLPIVTGGSEATVFVHDALGRQTAQTIALYDTSELLAPGLSEYSLEAGVLRRAYGVASFDYGVPLAAATWRHGLSDILTFQAHGEAAKDVQVAGAGVILALEPYATLGFDAAASAHDGGTGALGAISLHGQWKRFGVFAQYQAASRFYADVAVLGRAPVQRRDLQIGVSASLDSFGSLSVSSIEQDSARLVTASYSLGIAEHFLSVNGLYDRRTGHWFGGFSLNLLLGPREVVAVAGDDRAARLAYERDADPDGGFGWRAALSAGDDAGLRLQGAWYGDRLTANGDLTAARGAVGARLGVDGSIVMLGGNLYASKPSDGAVALVETGEPHVRIYRENREVAVSDDDGEALVPGLVPYAANRIRIDDDDYALATVVEHDERTVVPHRYGGVVVDLASPKRSPVLVTIRLENGLFPPVGAHARLGDAPLVVGRGGKLFIADLAGVGEVTVELPDGACRILVAPPSHAGGRIPNVGPLLCVRVARDA